MTHYHFASWPLHPIRFPVAFTDIINIEIVSVFTIWLIKFLIMRIGSFGLYRKVQPAVIGVLLGYVVGLLLSLFIDIVWFPGRGHNVHNW